VGGGSAGKRYSFWRPKPSRYALRAATDGEATAGLISSGAIRLNAVPSAEATQAGECRATPPVRVWLDLKSSCGTFERGLKAANVVASVKAALPILTVLYLYFLILRRCQKSHCLRKSVL
jgi:hypothetical protein